MISQKKIYTSLGRAKALQYCGWSSRHFKTDFSSTSNLENNNTFDDNMPCDYFVSTNESENNYTRIAAIMVFNGQISKAIENLNLAAENANKSINNRVNNEPNEKSISLNAISLALSSFINSNQIDNFCIWNDICSKLISKLDDSYIKAIFNFISTDFTEDMDKYNLIIVS